MTRPETITKSGRALNSPGDKRLQIKKAMNICRSVSGRLQTILSSPFNFSKSHGRTIPSVKRGGPTHPHQDAARIETNARPLRRTHNPIEGVIAMSSSISNTREAADHLQAVSTALEEHTKHHQEAGKRLESIARTASEDLKRQVAVLRTAMTKFLSFIRSG